MNNSTNFLINMLINKVCTVFMEEPHQARLCQVADATLFELFQKHLVIFLTLCSDNYVNILHS